MLPAGHRLRDSDAFREVVRRGRRAGGPSLVLHLWDGSAGAAESVGSVGAIGATGTAADRPVRVGLVVSKAVGPAVTRNLVKRRLRHQLRDRIPALPAGSVLVVRALPDAAAASYADLGGELDRALARLAGRR